MALKDRGVLGSRIETGESRGLPIDGQTLAFGRRVRLPIRPMIGSIGTAPSGEAIRAGKPGLHGGNMDCRLIEAGASVLLPVLVRGAQLALGDLHAVMGDGEVGCAGAEVAGTVALRVRLLRSLDLPLPFVLTADKAVTIFSADTLDQAATGAVERMAGVSHPTRGSLSAGRRHAPQPGWRSSRLPGRERPEDVPDGTWASGTRPARSRSAGLARVLRGRSSRHSLASPSPNSPIAAWRRWQATEAVRMR